MNSPCVARAALALLLLLAGAGAPGGVSRAAAQSCSKAALAQFNDLTARMSKKGVRPCRRAYNPKNKAAWNRPPPPVRLLSVPGGCAATPLAVSPAPAAPFKVATHFGKCEASAAAACPGGGWNRGSCIYTHSWCISDSPLYKESKNTPRPAELDLPSFPWCCCTTECLAGAGGKTVISYHQRDEDHIKNIKAIEALAPDFAQKVESFRNALEAAGMTKPRVEHTLRPAVKALTMHVTSCIASGCLKDRKRDPDCAEAFCDPGLKAGDAAAWAKVDQAARDAARAATAPQAGRPSWTAQEVAEAEAFLNKHTFVCVDPTRAGAPVDGAGSKSNVDELAYQFTMDYPASIRSRHMQGRAIDMTFTLPPKAKVPLPPDCTWPKGGALACPLVNSTRLPKICDQATMRCKLPTTTSTKNKDLWELARAFGVIKLAVDPPHWSDGS